MYERYAELVTFATTTTRKGTDDSQSRKAEAATANVPPVFIFIFFITILYVLAF